MQYGEGGVIHDENDGILGMQADKKDHKQRGYNDIRGNALN